METLKKNDLIGRKYEVFAVLGEGGFGIVYLVYSHETKSVYALKTFRDEYLQDIQTRDRFRKEAQVWIDLERHPYLVRAYFVDEISGRLYIAMEYIAPDMQGLNTLDAYLRKQPPDLPQTLRWAIQFCYGMEHAYSKGVKAHRDIKPANIMIGQDMSVKISDFGLAGVINKLGLPEMKSGIRQSVRGGAYQTVAGTAFGTPPYMPREQFENAADCDQRSDVYSFGIVLYQMVSGGNLPFYPNMAVSKADDSFQVWHRLHCKEPVLKLESPLFPVIQKCLEKEPRKRYQTFRELQVDLAYFLKRHTGEFVKLPKMEEHDFWDMGNKAVSLDRLGRHEEALFYYNKMLKVFPFDELTIFNKAICLTNVKRYEEAVQCYDQIITTDPDKTGAWNNKGICLEKLGNHGEALTCFRRVIALNPSDAESLINIGNRFYKAGKYHEALSVYKKVLDNNKHAIAWHNMALCFYALGMFDDAARSLRSALDIDPLYEDAWFNQGLLFQARQDAENAARCYDRVLHLNPERVTAWINKGKCLYLLGLCFESIKCYNKALEVDRHNIAAWYDKALFEDKCERYLDALSSYTKFLELASPQDREKIEFVLKRIQELKEAVR